MRSDFSIYNTMMGLDIQYILPERSGLQEYGHRKDSVACRTVEVHYYYLYCCFNQGNLKVIDLKGLKLQQAHRSWV